MLLNFNMPYKITPIFKLSEFEARNYPAIKLWDIYSRQTDCPVFLAPSKRMTFDGFTLNYYNDHDLLKIEQGVLQPYPGYKVKKGVLYKSYKTMGHFHFKNFANSKEQKSFGHSSIQIH